jgi:hypothetical protein
LIFDEIQNSKSLNICNFFVEMAKLLWYYTWNDMHENTVKSFIFSIGLNGNKFMNTTNVYSPKKFQYTSHGN